MQHKPYIIGIAGGTCSGKSTTAERLRERLANYSLKIINMDSYFKKPIPTTIAPITRIEYVDFNHPESLEQDRLYADFDEICASDEIEIIIIEGLFTLCLDRIRDKLDFKIFIDLKSDERIVRRIKRFMSTGQTFDEVVARYLDTVRYRHDEFIEPTRWHADIILNGTLDMHKGLDIVTNYVESELIRKGHK